MRQTPKLMIIAVTLALALPAQAGFFSFFDDIFGGGNKGSSSGSGSGNSGSGISGGSWQEPEYTLIYIPPAQPYIFVTVPISAQVTRGTVVSSEDKETINLEEFKACKEVDNRRPANDTGEPEEQENGIFIPYKSQDEWESFVQKPPSDVVIKDCGSTVVAVAVPGQWVQVLNYKEGPIAACARVGSTPFGGTGIKGFGICASDESAPGPDSGSAWENIIYANNLHHLKKSIIYKQKQGGVQITSSGGTYYCYKSGQKKDNDKTDLASAFLCTVPVSAATATATGP